MQTIRLFALLLFSASFLPAQMMTVLIRDGFPEADEHTQPANWGISHPNYLGSNAAEALWVSQTVNEELITVYRMTRRSEEGSAGFGSRKVAFPADTESLQIRVRMRGHNIKIGSVWWHLPGVGCTFHLPDGTTRPGMMSKWIYLPEGDSDWNEYTTLIPVRDNATEADIAFIAQGWTGVAEVERIEVSAVPASPAAQP
jgi:hypothetical protein